ncbi:MAG: polysaccharide deacetylase family protein [Alphaproteobacteria bacterium]|nr:polysaccharide deacetylase family protein [Alphaproteobacteria bacterium]
MRNPVPYSALPNRPRWTLPDAAKVALWVIPNIEHFRYGQPSTTIIPLTAGLVPDVLNHSWRDYGNRVGVWRMMDILQECGVQATAALNAEVTAEYPEIISAGRELGWEWMGHGMTNSTLLAGMAEDEERAEISNTLRTIAAATGAPPRGWLGPALTETEHTLDLLAEAGVDYVADWVNDEQPYRIATRSRDIYSIPYSIEINDITAFLTLGRSGEEFADMICDQFDVLYEDGATTGRVMSICLHPFLIGHPHRAKHFKKALKYITAHPGVWSATGSQIIDCYSGAEAGDGSV